MDMPDEFDSTLLTNWTTEEGSGNGGGKSLAPSSIAIDDVVVVGHDAATTASATALDQRQQPHAVSAPAANATAPVPSMFSANDGKGASSTERENNQSLLLHIGHHPLAMTSLASCPPHPASNVTAALAGGGEKDLGNGNMKQMQQQQQQQLCSSASSQQSQKQQDATASTCPIMFINNYIHNYHNQNSNINSIDTNFFHSIVNAKNDGTNQGNNVNNAVNRGNANNNNFAMTPTGYDLCSGSNNIINYNNNSSNSNTGSPYIGSALAAAVVTANTASASSHQANAQSLASHLHELRSNFQDSYATMPPPSMSLPMQMQMLLQHQVQQQQQQQQQQQRYGFTVNGFHPQVNAQTNHVDLPLPPLSLATSVTTTAAAAAAAAAHFRGVNGASTIPSTNSASYQFHPGANVNNIIGSTSSSSSCGINSTTMVAENIFSLDNGVNKEKSSSSNQKPIPAINSNNPVPALRGVYMNNNNNSVCSSITSRPTASSITAPSITAPSTDLSTTALHSRNSRDRNEREQVRAKKITQLITELRDNMQGGGWREEMKSKYQVLSQCRDYMEHLKRAHCAKEAAIEHTKKVYEEQQRRRQEQQQQALALMGDSPEKGPESETSSVSGSTAVGTSTGLSELNEVEEGSSSSSGRTSSVDGQQKRRRRKKETKWVAGEHTDDVQEQLVESLPNEESCKSFLARRGGQPTEQGKGRGVKRILGEDHNISYTDTSSISEEDNDDTFGGKDVTFHKDSTLSDMTDSNQSGTDGGSGGGANASFKGEEGNVSTSSISSTAAVVLGLESSHNMELMRRRRRVRSKRNPPLGEKISNSTKVGSTNPSTSHRKKRRGFHYDYKEVFLKSNVPQLIATLSGRIVVWNDFFLRATGLSEREAKRLTIFSIVQPNELSNLYKMVARALAEKCETSTSATTNGTSGNSSATEEWQAITLKCIPFPNDLIASKASLKITLPHASRGPHSLSITVALMKDVNRDQRCFHCILTDYPGSNGRLGSVTPELFAKLFNPTGVKVCHK